jgi:Tol biopolymer transport system component
MKTSRILAILVLVLAVGLPAGVANADFTFGEPTNLGPTVNSSDWDEAGRISADGLSLFFDSDRPGGYGSHDLWVTTRPTIYDPWGTPENLGPTVNSSAFEAIPSISADGLLLLFNSDRPGGQGDWDVWVTTRATTQDPWGKPGNLGQPVNSSDNNFMPSISSDGLSLFFCSTRPGGQGDWDVWVTTRTTISDPWGIPVNLGPPVNSSYLEQTPTISADGVVLFFSSNRPGGFGGSDLWLATRATVSDPWGEAVNFGPTVNSAASDAGANISRDGSTLYFCSSRPGGLGSWDIWQAPIIPIVDLNSDGVVDADDMCIMVDYWGTDESLCDIGPMPWGDGIVDVQDLIVLAEHLFEEIPSVE